MAALVVQPEARTLEFSNLSSDKYRGAVVEDLQLPPAFCLPLSEPISQAIALAYDRDFSHIPVLDRNRRPVGYLDVTRLKEQWKMGTTDPSEKVSKYMTRFERSASRPYTIITPITPLEVLEEFLKTEIFALVTDNGRKFVLAVATRQDLENFVSRRGS